MGPTMDVTGRYLNFGEPCDVSLQGTFPNFKLVFKMIQPKIFLA